VVILNNSNILLITKNQDFLSGAKRDKKVKHKNTVFIRFLNFYK